MGFLANEHEADAALIVGEFIRVADLYNEADGIITRRCCSNKDMDMQKQLSYVAFKWRLN